MPYLRRTFGAAQQWLSGINTAALERSLPVQICMALPSDAMASVQFDSMTNVRSSTDYGINDDRDDTPVQPGGLFTDSNFDVGGSSLLAWALDLRPSKVRDRQAGRQSGRQAGRQAGRGADVGSGSHDTGGACLLCSNADRSGMAHDPWHRHATLTQCVTGVGWGG